MNDLENPILNTAPARDTSMDAMIQEPNEILLPEAPVEDEIIQEVQKPVIKPIAEEEKDLREKMDFLAELRSQIGGLNHNNEEESTPEEKVRLQKVFKLFEWTNRNVKKFGQDRVDNMLESYREMGYVSENSSKLIMAIARLIPTDLGESHEIQGYEYVSELYELNHILDPIDSTLDRDMIEVLMEQRQDGKAKRHPGRSGISEAAAESDFFESKSGI